MSKPRKVVAFRGASAVAPSTVNGTVPNRRANDELRTRAYLTESEVDSILKVARQGRQGFRDHLMVLMAFRHGLRVGELCDYSLTPEISAKHEASLKVVVVTWAFC